MCAWVPYPFQPGFTFSQMGSGVTTFVVGNVPIKVAKLEKLLSSTKAAGRSKDKLFLKRYEILLKELRKKDKNHK